MADVADAAGVSLTTVSLALRGHQRISQQTTAKIVRVAEEIGYRLNVHASAIASRKFRTRAAVEGSLIVHITSVENRELGPGIQAQVEAVHQRATQLGYLFEHHFVIPGDDWKGLMNRLYSRGCEGIILGRIFPHQPPSDIDWSPFSVVARGGETISVHAHRVRSDHFKSARELYNRAVALGYQRIAPAVMRHESQLDDDVNRLGGIRAAQ